jgi:hypothetical protein
MTEKRGAVARLWMLVGYEAPGARPAPWNGRPPFYSSDVEDDTGPKSDSQESSLISTKYLGVALRTIGVYSAWRWTTKRRDVL